MKTITLLNEKGGVGKTTLAVHIAAGLAMSGQRVLLIDSDPQAHATKWLGCHELDGLLRLLAHETPWGDLLRLTDSRRWGGAGEAAALYLLPSHNFNRGLPMMLDAMNTFVLAERLRELRKLVDLVVIDTPPTPSLLHTMVYMASNYYLLPTTCEALSLDGLNKSFSHVQEARKTFVMLGLRQPEILGIVPTMYDERTNAHRHYLGLTRKHFGKLVWNPIAMRTIWRDVSGEQKTLFSSAPQHIAATEAQTVVDHVLRGVSSRV